MHHAALCLPLVAAGLGRSDGRQPAWIASLVLLGGVDDHASVVTWPGFPRVYWRRFMASDCYRGWAMQGLAAVYSPEHRGELRGVRRWHIAGNPAVGFVQWLGLIASAFGNRIRWRSIDYHLDSTGRVIFKRIVGATRQAEGRRLGQASFKRSQAHQAQRPNLADGGPAAYAILSTYN